MKSKRFALIESMAFAFGIVSALLIEMLCSRGVIAAESADCFAYYTIIRWHHLLGVPLGIDIAVVSLASILHFCLYGELLRDLRRVKSEFDNRVKSLIVHTYVTGLVPLVMVGGYGVMSVLFSEIFNWPGAINHGCKLNIN